jgi:hypothetical protein
VFNNLPSGFPQKDELVFFEYCPFCGAEFVEYKHGTTGYTGHGIPKVIIYETQEE